MIALAVSDFDLPRSLLAAGQIDVDYLETGGHFVERTVAQFPSRPLLLHNSVFNWSLAHPTALDEQQIVARTLAALERTRAPWLSVHLGFSAAEVFFDVHMTARSPALPRGGAAREHLPQRARAGGGYPCAADFGEFGLLPWRRIRAYLRAGLYCCGAERDRAPACCWIWRTRGSAHRGWGCRSRTIWGSCRWSGCASCTSAARASRDGVLFDAHEALLEEDYALLEWVLRRTQPLALTLEYNREEAELRAELARLRSCWGMAPRRPPGSSPRLPLRSSPVRATRSCSVEVVLLTPGPLLAILRAYADAISPVHPAAPPRRVYRPRAGCPQHRRLRRDARRCPSGCPGTAGRARARPRPARVGQAGIRGAAGAATAGAGGQPKGKGPQPAIPITVNLLITDTQVSRNASYLVVTAPRIDGFHVVVNDPAQLDEQAGAALAHYMRKWSSAKIVAADLDGPETSCHDHD